MVTLVGTQGNFATALKELVQLEYAATDAYDAAINGLENPAYKIKLSEFKEDNDRHIKEISNLLKKNKHEVPDKSILGKQLITTGKVILANMVGDYTILHAIKSNATDTNIAYKRMKNHKDKWADAQEIIKNGLQDEQRHKAWLENTLS